MCNVCILYIQFSLILMNNKPMSLSTKTVNFLILKLCIYIQDTILTIGTLF